MQIDISLKNGQLYKGCTVQEVAGRLNLTTEVKDAVDIVGRNVNEMIHLVPQAERGEVTLTGPMAVWAYLICFHAVVHAFNKVYYSDGRSDRVLIAAHGG